MHLIFTTGSALCALPASHTIETLRPLPVEPVEGAPAFVRGVSVIRGEPVPVVDLGALLGAPGAHSRFVTVRAGDRTVALAVEAVVGLRPLDAGSLPPLLSQAQSDVVETLTTLDNQLLRVLRTARLLPEGSP